ncbi:hypothetical protein [Niabella drilacis]|nr:hypothetical protein [Niabella drilacis]
MIAIKYTLKLKERLCCNKLPVFIVLMLFAPLLLFAQAGLSWLPSPGAAAAPVSAEIHTFLKGLSGNMRVLACGYRGAQLGSLEPVPVGKKGTKNEWELNIDKYSEQKEDQEIMDLTFRFKREGRTIADAGVALAIDFGNWDVSNYVMIPASVYNGNRNRIVTRGYNEGVDRSDLYRKDLPQTTTSLPQLSPNAGELSRLEINISNTATPAVCIYDRRKGLGFVLLCDQGIMVKDQVIDHGLILEENKSRTQATLVVSAPGVRERKPEFIGFSKSPDRGITWSPGDAHTIKLRLYKFKAKDIPGFLNTFSKIRKDLTGKNQPRQLVPFSAINQIMTRNIDKRYYEGKFSFYCPENADWISFGWIGGLINTFPMLALNDALHRERVMRTFDFGMTYGQGRSGYFWGALNKDGWPFGREAYNDRPEIVLTRKNADVLYWMVKQFELMRAQGHAAFIKADWEWRIRKLADAFVKTWKEEGQWGNDLDHETGKVAVYNSSGGVMAIAGLALASRYYHNPEYLRVAEAAAAYYYKNFALTGMTTGACADILQNADSETAIAFTTALMTLYEFTGKPVYLRQSRDLANLAATWTTSFDYRLPAYTALAKLGAKLTGAVWASTQNKHGAPGFCTQSGDALFRIYRSTGEQRYAELLYDIAHAYAEGIQPNGHITERLTYCDADSRGSRGDGGKTGWNETNGALMSLEIPGVYLRTDIDRFFVFDHLEGRVTKRDQKHQKVWVELHNPTPYAATVRLLAENGNQSAKALKLTSFLDWKKIEIGAGQTSRFVVEGTVIKKNG